MRLLLDTHCWLWYLLTPERLNPKAQEILRDPDNEVFFSTASAWEHKDPFDRVLVAQAQVESLQFLTADKVLMAYDVPILWAGLDNP